MKRRTLVLGLLVVLVAGATLEAIRNPEATRSVWSRLTGSAGAAPQAPRPSAPRGVPVEVAIAHKGPVPVRIDALGNVTPIASVAVKPRIDTEIVGVHFRDGAT